MLVDSAEAPARGAALTGLGCKGLGMEGFCSGSSVATGVAGDGVAIFFAGGGVCSACVLLATGISSWSLFVSCATGGRGFEPKPSASSASFFSSAAVDAASRHVVPDAPNLYKAKMAMTAKTRKTRYRLYRNMVQGVWENRSVACAT
jgi:hypothetical protein